MISRKTRKPANRFVFYGVPPNIKVGIRGLQMMLGVSRVEVLKILYDEYMKRHGDKRGSIKRGAMKNKLRQFVDKALGKFLADETRHHYDRRAGGRPFS